MKTLHLPLKKEWYNMIESGVKTEEYREIKPAKFEREVSIGIDRQPIYKTRCVIEPNCFYDQALNEKNFIKRLKRLGMIE